MSEPAVTVAVATFRRNEHLAELLPLLVAQVDDVPGADVLIVDNDPSGGACPVVATVTDPRVRYVHEPRPGLTAVRNRVLDECSSRDAVAFMDDDERPEPRWLSLMVRTWAATGADAVAGRVLERYEIEPDPWIEAGGFFRRRSLETGTLVAAAPTSNLLLDLGSLRRRGLRFDERFGLTGGEDTHLTSRLVREGGRIAWCDEGRVTDLVPAARMTRTWVLDRARSHGNTTTLVDLALAGGPAAALAVRVKALVGGAGRWGVGHAMAASGRLRRSRRLDARGRRMAHRGVGMMTAALGHRVVEYAR